MAGLRAFSTFLVLALLYSAVFSAPNATNPEQDIPQRCIDNSTTPLSCKNVDNEDGLVPHPDDCELFYYCPSPKSKPVCRQCPAQLHFNPIKRVCDNPEDAGCQPAVYEEPKEPSK
ncbi:uncharacterized protein LOC116774399 [Danaus plexippus]|uniref:uncharacterized protein LOC116774399 n=1 Tax=Danaus plexippus TaxID=13037 RepID=UPI002AAFCF1C|nr:uncharacterized protein LOC116774399 [Danaus plexippus]